MVTGPPADWHQLANRLADRLGRYTNCGHEAGPSIDCQACNNLALVNEYLRAELDHHDLLTDLPGVPLMPAAPVLVAAWTLPAGCDLPGCAAHLAPALAWELAAGPMPDAGCSCPGWFDRTGYHIARVNPRCTAHLPDHERNQT